MGQTRSFDDVRETSTLPRLATNERTLNEVRLVPILLQKSLAISVNGDSVALMRFAMEAIDDGAAQSRPR
jgi:hypothetical protein